MSSYDLPQTQAELRSTFALVRLQIVSPLSLLVSIGANLVCSLFIKPSMGAFLILLFPPSLLLPLSLKNGAIGLNLNLPFLVLAVLQLIYREVIRLW